jgi:hypothetical protein
MIFTNQYYHTAEGNLKVTGVYFLGNRATSVEIMRYGATECEIMTLEEFNAIEKREYIPK